MGDTEEGSEVDRRFRNCMKGTKMAIDDPLETIRQLAKEGDFDGIGAALQAGAIFSPVFKVFSVAKGIADSYKKGEKVTIAIHALCDELQRMQERWPKDLESEFDKVWFRRTMTVLMIESARAANEDYARFLGRVAAHGCFPTGSDAHRQEDLASYILDLARLGSDMLYAYRFKIELGFRQGVHVLGAYAYHFWMCGMKPLKRGDGHQYLHRTSHAYRAAIRRKMAAFHVHVQLGCIAQGLLQHLSLNYTAEVWLCFRSWLRTMNPALPPSELVVANALRSAIPRFFSSSQLDPKLKKILNQYRRSDILCSPHRTHDIRLACKVAEFPCARTSGQSGKHAGIGTRTPAVHSGLHSQRRYHPCCPHPARRREVAVNACVRCAVSVEIKPLVGM